MFHSLIFTVLEANPPKDRNSQTFMMKYFKCLFLTFTVEENNIEDFLNEIVTSKW